MRTSLARGQISICPLLGNGEARDVPYGRCVFVPELTPAKPFPGDQENLEVRTLYI
jgi:hypothetical protein